MPAPVASGWSVHRVGLAPTGKRRLLTAHVDSCPGGRLRSSEGEFLKVGWQGDANLRHFARQRRILPVPMGPGERRLTEPTTAVRRWQLDQRDYPRLLTCALASPPEAGLDRGESDEGVQGFRKVLEILGKTPVAPEPGAAYSTLPPPREGLSGL